MENGNKTMNQSDDAVSQSDDVSADSGPQDKGWAWMVTLGAFIVMLLVPGYHTVIAVLLLDIVHQFNTTIAMVTVMQSVGLLAYCVSCQLTTNWLVDKFSVRTVTVTASVVNAGAQLAMTLASDMLTFTFFFIVKSFSHGALVPPTLTLVGVYFRRRRALASAIALLGISCASILVPPMLTLLRDQFGFSGCLLMLAAYEMQGIVATSLFRPLDSAANKTKKLRDISYSKNDAVENALTNYEETNGLNTVKCHAETENLIRYTKNSSKKSLSEAGSHHMNSNNDIDKTNKHELYDKCSNTDSHTGDYVLCQRGHHIQNPALKHDENYNHPTDRETSNISNAWPWVSDASLAQSLKSNDSKSLEQQERKGTQKTDNSILEVIRSILDFSVLRDWSCFSAAFGYAVSRSTLFAAIYIPAHATTSGVTSHRAAALVTVYGLVDMVSRIVFGYIGDLHLIQPKYVIVAANLLLTVFCLCGSLYQTFETLLVFSVALGALGGVSLSLNTNNIVAMAGLERLAQMLSLTSLLLALSLTIQFPVLGLLISATGHFVSVFYYVAGTSCLATLLYLTSDVRDLFVGYIGQQ